MSDRQPRYLITNPLSVQCSFLAGYRLETSEDTKEILRSSNAGRLPRPETHYWHPVHYMKNGFIAQCY